MLAADLLHAARPLRPADDRREGAQAEGRAPRPARHPGRRALHPLLALRALLRRGHRHGRARHLPPRRPVRDRALPGPGARQQVFGERGRHLPRGRLDRTRLPLRGAGLVPRRHEVRLPGVRARVQRRGARQPPPPAPQRGPPGRPAQAPVQRRRQQVVDLRRRALRLQGRGRQDAARGAVPPRGRHRDRRQLGRGDRGRRRRARTLRPRRDRHPRVAADGERGPLRAPPRARAPRYPSRRLPRAAGRGRGPGRDLDPRGQEPERARRRAPGPRRRRRRAPGRGPRAPGEVPLDLRPRPPGERLAAGPSPGRARGGRDPRLGRRKRERTSERAHWVLPAAAWVEREGTYTNFEGRVQRLRQAVEPLGQALPEWEILGRILEALGAGARPPRAERWFRELAAATPAFAGLSYQAIGDGGQMVRA